MMTLEEFKATHPAGFLKVPKLAKRPKLAKVLGQNGRPFFPGFIDERETCTPTEDQGETSMCAAYATTSFAEHIYGKRTGLATSFDPKKVYAEAKKMDGDQSDGTTIEHAIEGFLKVYPDVFGPECSCELIYSETDDPIDVNLIKRAIHKYGGIVGGFNISTKWYDVYQDCKGWIGSEGYLAGGHGVFVCGYNSKGLIIQNSWGRDWGEFGLAVLPWSEVPRQFMYGGVIKGCMNNFD